MSETAPEAVQSRYLGGKLTLWQASKGYRAAIDPALLAASLDLKPGTLAVEFGCGPGAALLSAAHLHPEVSFIGIEQDVSAAALADRNRHINTHADRVAIVCADVMDWKGPDPDQDGVKADLKRNQPVQIDAVFFNPPFFDDASRLRAPAEAKTAAWINDTSLNDWIAAGLKRVREGGQLTLIQRADRLADILAALQPKAGGVRVLPVHPKVSDPAKRVVVSAIKTSKAPLQLLPGLVLHDASGGYTPEADAILRGEGRTALADRAR